MLPHLCPFYPAYSLTLGSDKSVLHFYNFTLSELLSNIIIQRVTFGDQLCSFSINSLQILWNCLDQVFLLIATSCSIVWMHHSLLNQSPIKHIRIISSLGYYKQSCCKYSCTSFPVNISFHFFGIYARECGCWSYGTAYSVHFCFLRKLPNFSRVALLFYIPINSV